LASVRGTISTPAGQVVAADVAVTFFPGRAGSFTAPPRDELARGRPLILELSDGRVAGVRITGEVAARPGAVVYGFALTSRLVRSAADPSE
jgi:hypothetical protein